MLGSKNLFDHAASDSEALEALDKPGAKLIAGSRWLARQYRERYNRTRFDRGEQAWRAPRILTWRAWVGELRRQLDTVGRDPHPWVRLNSIQERLLWERTILNSEFGGDLLAAAETARSARDAWSLMHAWDISPQRAAAVAGDDVKAFLEWRGVVCDQLEGNRWLDEARISDTLVGSTDQLQWPRRLYLAGMAEMSPQRERLLEAARSAGVELWWVEVQRLSGDRSRVALPDPDQELDAAARWARNILEQGDTGTIGIVVPDLASRRREVERAFLAVLDQGAALPGSEQSEGLLRLSGGPSLAEQSIVRSALAALELDPRARNPLSIWTALLLSPHTSGYQQERSARALADAQLRRIGDRRLSWPSVLGRLAKGCTQLQRRLERLRRRAEKQPARQSAAAWAHAFALSLRDLGWPGEGAVSRTDYRVGEAWRELLSSFASLDVIGGDWSRREAAESLRRMAQEAIFAPETSPAAVEILDRDEARGARIEHLWVCGMDEQSWPPPARPNPFLPIRTQHRAGVPAASHERALRAAEQTSADLMAAAESTVISHPARCNDVDRQVSRLFVALPARSIEELGIAETKTYWAAVAGSSLLETLEDAQAPPADPEALHRGGVRAFQHQARCGFRAFAEIRLGALPLEAAVSGLGPRDRGSLVHSVMEEVWNRLRNHKRLCSLDAAALESVVGASVDKAIETREDGPLPDRFRRIERARLIGLVSEWLEHEKKRPPFEVLPTEQRREIEIGGVRAALRIDRIDRMADGREVVVDYKTGNVSKSEKWDQERITDPQLPLYAVTHPGRIGAALLAQIKTGSQRFYGVTDSPAAAPGLDKSVCNNMDARIADWRRRLEAVAVEFREGTASTQPSDKACAYCPLPPLCRKDEQISTGAKDTERQ